MRSVLDFSSTPPSHIVMRGTGAGTPVTGWVCPLLALVRFDAQLVASSFGDA